MPTWIPICSRLAEGWTHKRRKWREYIEEIALPFFAELVIRIFIK